MQRHLHIFPPTALRNRPFSRPGFGVQLLLSMLFAALRCFARVSFFCVRILCSLNSLRCGWMVQSRNRTRCLDSFMRKGLMIRERG